MWVVEAALILKRLLSALSGVAITFIIWFSKISRQVSSNCHDFATRYWPQVGHREIYWVGELLEWIASTVEFGRVDSAPPNSRHYLIDHYLAVQATVLGLFGSCDLYPRSSRERPAQFTLQLFEKG